MKLGIENFIENIVLQKPLVNRRLGFLGHAASVDHRGRHSLDLLKAIKGINVKVAFSPQHGFHSEKQDNMIESGHFYDPERNISVYSLYSEVRKPTPEMMDAFDVLIVDMQDLGCRVYTYFTTLLYMLEACSSYQKQIWLMDRPNPSGRKTEGLMLEEGWESFIGSAPVIMRYGMTVAEMGLWYKDLANLDLELHIVPMTGYDLSKGPGFGWPVNELSWVNPSPNASSLNMARCYAGTVLIEGSSLSEGRGTSAPLEMIGAPDLDTTAIQSIMENYAPEWLEGCVLRPCSFEPTSDRFAGILCKGWQIHTDNQYYRPDNFKPFRLCALILKSIRLWNPGYPLWINIPFEYEKKRLPIDLLNGGPKLRQWVDDSQSSSGDLEKLLTVDEEEWIDVQASHKLYTT